MEVWWLECESCYHSRTKKLMYKPNTCQNNCLARMKVIYSEILSPKTCESSINK